MSYAIGGDRIVDRRRLDPPQTDIGAGKGGDGPGETPAVAMEHRQRPEINRVGRHGPDHHVADGVQEGAAVMVDDALRVAGGAGCVIQRTGVPFVSGPLPRVFGIAACDEVLVFHGAEERSAVIGGVIDIDNEDIGAECFESAFDRVRKLPVGQQDLRFAVLEDKGDGVRIETDIQRIQDTAHHGDAEMGFDHRRDVRQHGRDGVAALEAVPFQRARQPSAPRIGLGPAAADIAVDNGRPVRIGRCRAFYKAKRRKGLEIGRVLVESDLERVGHFPAPNEGLLFRGNNTWFVSENKDRTK